MIPAEIATTPSAGSFWEFCLVIAFIVGVLVNIVTIVFLVSNRKERREVSFAVEPASKEEFDRHVAEDSQMHKDIFSKIGGVERGAQSRLDASIVSSNAKLDAAIHSGNVSREKLHLRINELLAAIARLEGRLEQ